MTTYITYLNQYGEKYTVWMREDEKPGGYIELLLKSGAEILEIEEKEC